MDIDKTYKRRVRVVGKPNDPYGGTTSVQDIDTGEAITNIFRVEIVLDANEVNVARLHYYAHDEETGKLLATEDGDLITGTVVIQNPEVDVVVFEE